MTPDEIPEEWLESFNARMGVENVPHIRRPWLALMEWTKTRQCKILGGSPAERKVFEWFYARSPEGAHLVPDVHQGVFYFDSAFWPVRVPVMYVNNARVDISQLLLMPEPVKSSLLQQPGPSALYKATWADCFDYSYGLDDDRHEKQLSMHAPFLPSADQQLLASESLLLQRPAQPKSIESSRMAVEIFLKAYLCIHHGFTEAAARGFSHNLETALHAILSLAPASELQRLRGRFGVFPSVGERYEGKSYAGEQLWEAYSIALYTGASIARSISSRNMRGQFGLVF